MIVSVGDDDILLSAEAKAMGRIELAFAGSQSTEFVADLHGLAFGVGPADRIRRMVATGEGVAGAGTGTTGGRPRAWPIGGRAPRVGATTAEARRSVWRYHAAVGVEIRMHLRS